MPDHYLFWLLYAWVDMCPIMVMELLVPSHDLAKVYKQLITLSCHHFPLISVVMDNNLHNVIH